MLAALRDPELDAAFGVRTATFRHDFAKRRDLALDLLADVTQRIPMAWIYAHEAQRSPLEGRGAEPGVDCRRVPEFLRDLSGTAVSIRIYNLERTEDYGDLTRTVEPRVREFVGDREGGVTALNLGLFAASPRTVTPAHPDRHHNLLLQLRGRKQIWLEDDADARRHHVRVLDYLRCPPAGVSELPPARTLVLEPGDGVYIPPYTFHWTELFDESGTALSIGFSTEATTRDTSVHEFDLRLRKLGVRPRAAPPESVRGRAKARLGLLAAERSARRSRRRVSVSRTSGGQS